MKYWVYIGDIRVGKVRTLLTATGPYRLINIFGAKATKGLPLRWNDCKFNIDWEKIDSQKISGPWKLKEAQ